MNKLLNDLNGYEDSQVLITDLLKDLKHHHSELLDSWTRQLTLQINNKSLRYDFNISKLQIVNDVLLQSKRN